MNAPLNQAVEHVDITQLVPPRQAFTGYLPRTLSPRYTDLDLLHHALQMGQNVFLHGPAGSGKTSAPIAYAAREGLPVYVVTCSAALDVVDVFGKFVPRPDGGLTWVYGKLVEVVRQGGVVVFDEATSMNPKVSPIFHSLTDFRRSITVNAHRGEIIPAHPHLLVVATGNLGYVGTTPMNEAFRDRFDIQREWDYDTRVEAKLVASKTLVTLVKEIRKLCSAQRIDVPISTRALVALDKQMRVQGFEVAMDNFAGRFEGTQAAAIRQVFKTYQANLKSDYGSAPASAMSIDEIASRAANPVAVVG